MWQENLAHNIKNWWKYQRTAQGKYYLHSPFVFRFYTEILEPAPDEICLTIDNELFRLKQNRTAFLKSSVNRLAKQEPALKYGKVIYRLLKQSQVQYALDLETSLGISAAYMAFSKHDIVVTVVGKELEYVKTVHRNLGLKNVDYSEFLTGALLRDFPRLDAVFFSASDEEIFEKLLTYTQEETIFIVNNIHESVITERVWEEIKQNEKVTLTIDLYKIGLVFFRKENLAKTDFVLRY